jgi:hypothetical protein
MPPSNVNLKAFESRLSTIFSHMSRSTKTGTAQRRTVDLERMPARSIAERKTLASSVVNAARSVGWKTAPDAARLDAREVEQRVDERRSLRPLRLTTSSCPWPRARARCSCG